MHKAKAQKVILTLIFITTFLLFIASTFSKYSIAKSSELDTEWNVKITSGTKDLTSKDTQEIKFIVQDNKNVAKGKLAPGGTAVATMELDLNKTKYAVDFELQADISKLNNNFELTAKIDGDPYIIGATKVFELQNNEVFNEKNGKKIITLILKWKSNDSLNELDTLTSISKNVISIPITWTAKQHI